MKRITRYDDGLWQPPDMMDIEQARILLDKVAGQWMSEGKSIEDLNDTAFEGVAASMTSDPGEAIGVLYDEGYFGDDGYLTSDTKAMYRSHRPTRNTFWQLLHEWENNPDLTLIAVKPISNYDRQELVNVDVPMGVPLTVSHPTNSMGEYGGVYDALNVKAPGDPRFYTITGYDIENGYVEVVRAVTRNTPITFTTPFDSPQGRIPVGAEGWVQGSGSSGFVHVVMAEGGMEFDVPALVLQEVSEVRTAKRAPAFGFTSINQPAEPISSMFKTGDVVVPKSPTDAHYANYNFADGTIVEDWEYFTVGEETYNEAGDAFQLINPMGSQLTWTMPVAALEEHFMLRSRGNRRATPFEAIQSSFAAGIDPIIEVTMDGVTSDGIQLRKGWKLRVFKQLEDGRFQAIIEPTATTVLLDPYDALLFRSRRATPQVGDVITPKSDVPILSAPLDILSDYFSIADYYPDGVMTYFITPGSPVTIVAIEASKRTPNLVYYGMDGEGDYVAIEGGLINNYTPMWSM